MWALVAQLIKKERKAASESQIASIQRLILIQEKPTQRNKILFRENGGGSNNDHLDTNNQSTL